MTQFRFGWRAAGVAAAGAFALVAPALGDQPAKDWQDAPTVYDGRFEGRMEASRPLDLAGDVTKHPGSVWVSYAPSKSTFLLVESCGSEMDTTITIWHQAPEAGLELLTADDECDLQSIVLAPIEAKQFYYIQLSDKTGRGGNYVMHVKAVDQPRPAPPDGPVGGLVGGPDIILSNIPDSTHPGVVGGVDGYAFGGWTCNMGDTPFLWASNGTPSLAMNAYRLNNGRLQQIGLGFCKRACCVGNGTGCPEGLTCGTGPTGHLRPGCRDVYGAGFNAGQSWLAPRSSVNPFSKSHTTNSSATSGDAIFERLQIARADMSATTYPNALYFYEGVFIASDESAANVHNNASYRRFTVANTGATPTYNHTLVDETQWGTPAIFAWQTHGNGLNTPDNSVHIQAIDIPGEGRLYLATKVTSLGAGLYRYDYAIENLNSDRSVGQFLMPSAPGTVVTDQQFSDVNYHSGEIYDSSDWAKGANESAIGWQSPEGYDENPNSNALRWGTMYNFWFTANRPPRNAAVTLGLFKPGTPESVSAVTQIPGWLKGDMNCDGAVNNFDIDPFVQALLDAPAYIAAFPQCDINNGDVNGVDGLNNFDIDAFVTLVIGP